MKITTLLGSPRKKGNTATIVGWLEEELTKTGWDAERIFLHSKEIKGCLACEKCKDHPDRIACVQKDDAIGIMEKMIASDLILYACPIYFWGFTAQLKALVDRSYSLVANYLRPGHTSLLKDKRIALLVTGGDAFENNAEGLFTAFDRIVQFLMAQKAGELYVGGCTAPSELPEAVKAKTLKLARTLAG